MMARKLAGALAAFALVALLGGTQMQAQQPTTQTESVDSLARDVARVESLRAVKNVQRLYSQLGQHGQWRDMASLFSKNGAVIWGEQKIEGHDAIAAWLMARSGGGSKDGLAPGALHVEMIDEPLVNLSVDGQTANGRWMGLAFLGDGKGHARIEGGVYENEYVQENGQWKIAALHYFPQYEGPYAEGWTNVGGQDLPVVKQHFTPNETGVPVPPAQGAAPASGLTRAQVEARIASLNDEDAVRNLQNAYGYYVDRKMWDDIVDLFAQDSAAEIYGQSVTRGPEGVRKAIIAHMGPAGLRHGELNERALFDTTVIVALGGREAEARGIELGMLGDADKGAGSWEISVFRNRFIKQDGIWRFKELRITPIMAADYYVGWGNGGTKKYAKLPAYSAVQKSLTGAAAALATTPSGSLTDARRKLQRSLAFDAVENVSTAYGNYLDDFQWAQMGAIFAAKGNKQSPFTGYYLGSDRIMGALNASYGPAKDTRRGIAYHWRTQPVIHVSQDGRSANLRTRLFQPMTYKDRSKDGGLLKAGFHSGMYPNDQAVLEPDGVWRLWSLTIDEHYFESVDWKGGWAAAKDPTEDYKPKPTALMTKYPPDIPITDLGRREEGFRGGTGKTLVWPQILPMWFHYRNPVSGREPALFWPDCVPCEKLPEARMTAHGYQAPPNGPEIDGVEIKTPPR
jgi:hypothetical protein